MTDLVQDFSSPAVSPAAHPVAPAPGEGVGDERVPVDPEPTPTTIYATALATRDTERRPIVPAYLRNRDEARHLAGWLAKFGAHVTAYHLSRAPLYALRLALRAPRGLAVAVVAAERWVLDAEGAPLRAGAVSRGDASGYMTLARERNRRVHERAIIAGACAVLAAVAAVAGWWWAPGWVLALALVVAVAVLGKVGTPRDRRVTDVATTSSAAPPRLTADVVTRALQSLGISAMAAKAVPPSFVAPITRDGPGWRADVDLPHGVTVSDVMERRDRLASGLRRPLSAVWPEASSEQHAGRLVLWVGDQPLNKVRPAVWPLAKAGAVQVIGGRFPFGTDQRQRPVKVALEETNALIGALPGGGKTAAVRVLALAAALDPHCELRIGEHKGSGDLEALGLVAHRYASGVDDEALAATLDSLRELLDEVGRRAKTVAKLPRTAVPDRKVTPELAARKGSGLHPIVQVIDEAQELFTHPDLGKEAGEVAERIIKRGRAFGVYLVIATQRPDAKSVPSGVAGNVGLRFCLRVTGQVENDMVLGTSAYRNGIRATTLTPSDRGIGYLVGAGDDPQVVRTYYVDGPAAEKIAQRARAAREAAGTLTGHAAGEVVDEGLTPAAQLLEDLAVVFATVTDERVWSETVLHRLAEHRPALYAGWTPEALAAALKPFGITTGQVWGRTDEGAGANRRGVTRADVLAAIETHHRARAEIAR
ncbi:FtsK/SpoIIIE domain-containing protein [Pseudonocardia parietis]|uniref:S-DNA-T family DNA segregation ATPase FtsK/SpoIIIE n=1 Tax=Pseudonocardia parietis TaxID=570936 RepID=A0ABS4W3B8_9PSEU|nr:FtsK/SpoIIIE domain-containing protein [Pseudonocardia parietis]MBP2370681.1 S-DNA-T family DNA segregation ATPase FtsK/SpoIIIE [Pseudonocardia parietis]